MTCAIVTQDNERTCQLFLTEQYFFLFCVVNEANQPFPFEQRLLFEFALVNGEKLIESINTPQNKISQVHSELKNS